MRKTAAEIRVWDPFVRFFHWSLVLAYAAAWATGDEWAALHERVGYYILVVLGLRVAWGLIGTRYARFGDFLYRPGRIVSYLRSLRGGQAEHYLGHNPAGGWMVVALLVSLLAAAGSGLMIGGADAELWEEIHEALVNLTLVLVCVHVAGVVVSSVLHHENLVRAMVTGRKTGRIDHV